MYVNTNCIPNIQMRIDLFNFYKNLNVLILHLLDPCEDLQTFVYIYFQC